MPTLRNPIARAPILRKGGVHQKPKSGERQKAKQALKGEVRRLPHRPYSQPTVSSSLFAHH